MTLTKAKLAVQVQRGVYGVKPWEAQRLVQRVLEIITAALVRGEDVLISGFGKWMVRRKHPRRGRNPQTGEDLLLSERRVVVFKPSTTLRRRLNPQAGGSGRPGDGLAAAVRLAGLKQEARQNPWSCRQRGQKYHKGQHHAGSYGCTGLTPRGGLRR